MGKRRTEARQDVLLLTGVGDVELLTLDAEPLFITSPDTIEAWESDLNQQAKDDKTGRLVQVISDISKKPIKVYKERPALDGQTTEVIASRKQDEELAFMDSRKMKNSLVLWVGIIAALFAVVISIGVLLRFREAGAEAAAAMAFVAVSELRNRVFRPRNVESIISDDEVASLTLQDVDQLFCFIFVEKTRTMVRRMLSTEHIPDGYIERNYKGNPCCVLGLDKENKFWLIEAQNKVEVNESPQDLFIALQCEKEVNETYGLSDSALEKVKIGILVGLCFAELIVLFLIFGAAAGG